MILRGPGDLGGRTAYSRARAFTVGDIVLDAARHPEAIDAAGGESVSNVGAGSVEVKGDLKDVRGVVSCC